MNYGESTFNLQVLEGRCFDRAQKWANLIQNLSQTDSKMEEKEIDFDEIENYFDAEDEHIDSSDNSMEIAEGEEEEEPIVRKEEKESIKRQLNQTIALLRAGNDLESRLNIENTDNDDEMQDLLNLTVPVLMEHKRKFKEEGLDDILTSFNPTAIEEAKCNWQRRHCNNYEHKNHPPANKNSCQMSLFYSNKTFHRETDCRPNCDCHLKKSSGRTLMRQQSYDMTPPRCIMSPGVFAMPQPFPHMQTPCYHGMYNENQWPNEMSQFYNGYYQNSFAKLHYNMFDRPMTPQIFNPCSTPRNSMALMHSTQRGLSECRGNPYRQRAETDSMLYLNRREPTRRFESSNSSGNDIKSQINVMETTLSCISIAKTTSRQSQDSSHNDHTIEGRSDKMAQQKGRKLRTRTKTKSLKMKIPNKQLKKSKQLKDAQEEFQEKSDTSDMDFKLAIANSMKTYENEQQKIELTNRRNRRKQKNEIVCKPLKPHNRDDSPMPKTMLNTTTDSTNLTSTLKGKLEDTLFNRPICNSTVITANISKEKELSISTNVSESNENFGCHLENTQMSDEANKITIKKDKEVEINTDQHETSNVVQEKDDNKPNKSVVLDPLPKNQFKPAAKLVQKEKQQQLKRREQQQQKKQEDEKQHKKEEEQHISHFSSDDSMTNADVTVIEKTTITNETKTDSNFQQNNNANKQNDVSKDILVYKSPDGGLSPENKTVKITEQILSKAIGKEASKKFFKFYVGFREFNAKCNIYYRPPECKSENDFIDDDDSDTDVFEVIESCGKLYAVYE